MHREIGKESFLEAFLPEGIGRNDSLERIGEVVDWEPGRVGRGYLRGRGGKAKMMVKVMLLQQWYGAERARAVGLGLHEESPSQRSRFRGMLTERGVVEGMMEELNRQMEEKGLMVKADAGGVPGEESRRKRRRPRMRHGHGGTTTGTRCMLVWTRGAG